jgi:hypothetical protein
MSRKIRRNAQKAFQKLQNVASNAKAGAVVATGALVTSTSSFGAVTYDAATGFGGSIELTPYYSSIPIVVTVIGVSIATTLGLNILKRAR